MLADLTKIWSMFTPTEKRKAAWMLGLAVLMAAAETVGVLSVMPFLSVLGRPAVIEENDVLRYAYFRLGFQTNRDFLIALGLASIATVVGAATFKTVTLHAINRFIHFLRHSISSKLLNRYLHQPYEFFLTHNTSQLGRNVLSEVDQLLFNLIQPVSQLIAQGTVVIAMVVLVFWYNPLIAVIIVSAVAALYAAIFNFAKKKLVRIGNERQIANGVRFQSCSEALDGIKDVKITASATSYQGRFDSASRSLSRHMAAGETIAQAPLFLAEAVGYTGLILIALFLMLKRNDIAHVLPAMGLYGFAAFRMLPAMQIMYRGMAKLKFSSSALETIYRDLSLPEEPQSTNAEMLRPLSEIRLDAVSFAYPSAPAAPILDNFDLRIAAGSSIAIVGRTGAGKSTLMDILLGLLIPQAGTLRIDGVPVNSSNVSAWHRAIGYVPQHIYLADASVAENIAFGVPRASIDVKAVERAARAAQIHDFVVSRLEQGYETPIGDRGIRLSGGQRQRIGIARALYRDPPVLFLDEATSALDAETELAVTDAIQKLSGTKTIVVISHKASSIEGCDALLSIGD